MSYVTHDVVICYFKYIYPPSRLAIRYGICMHLSIENAMAKFPHLNGNITKKNKFYRKSLHFYSDKNCNIIISSLGV